MKSRAIRLIIFSFLLTAMSHFIVYFTPIKVTKSINVELTQKHKGIISKDWITEEESEYLEKESMRIMDEIAMQREAPVETWKDYRAKAALVSWVPWLVFFLFYKLRNTKEVVYVLSVPVLAAIVLVVSWAELLVIVLAIAVTIAINSKRGAKLR